MKILHLEASTGFGGQEIRILREAEGLRARGHTIVLAVSHGASLAAKARQSGFSVYELSFQKRSWPLSLIRLLSIFRRHQIEIINTHSSLDAWLGGIAARLSSLPIVRTRHLSTAIRKGLNSRLLYGTLADFVVTTSEAIVDVIVRQSGKDPSCCLSIPTGVDVAAIQSSREERAQFRQTLPFPASHFLIGTACVMRSWKGIDDLLEAAHLLRETPGIGWVVIGGGHAERHWKRAKELSLEGLVHFTGHLDRPFAAIESLDLFCLLSTNHEGVSQALLQAAFLKRPLIATTIGGLPEVCIHEQTGLLIPPAAPHQLKEAILRLKEDPLLRAKFGEAAHLLVQQRFRADQTFDAMESLFRKLLAKKWTKSR